MKTVVGKQHLADAVSAHSVESQLLSQCTETIPATLTLTWNHHCILKALKEFNTHTVTGGWRHQVREVGKVLDTIQSLVVISWTQTCCDGWADIRKIKWKLLLVNSTLLTLSAQSVESRFLSQCTETIPVICDTDKEPPLYDRQQILKTLKKFTTSTL